MKRISIVLALALAFAACGKGSEARVRLRLATTTSTENSGLLKHMLEPFQQREGIEVQVVAVGTGQALELGRRGDADVILVHARKREDEFVAKGYGVDRRDVMWNDFVVAGPAGDPAGVRGVRDAARAFQRIREARARFVSRGDDSGTHIRELSLWERAGGVPTDTGFYLSAGQGMGKCLIIADQKRAYILVDRGTYLAFRRKLQLEVLVEGDALLRNPYGIIMVNPSRHSHVEEQAGRKLLDYFTSPEGQRRIGEYRVDGNVLFHPVNPG